MLDASKLPGDMWLAWGVILASVIIAVAPAYFSRVKEKAKQSDPSHSAPAGNTTNVTVPAAAQLDSSSQLLVEMVRGLEQRAREAEAQREALRKENEAAQQQMRLRIDELEDKLRDSTAEVARLRAQVDILLRQR